MKAREPSFSSRPRPAASWRYWLRESVSYAVVLLLLAGFALVVAMSRAPDAPIFERLAEWPLIGGIVERGRERFRMPTPGDQVAATDEPDEVGSREGERFSRARPVGVGVSLWDAPEGGRSLGKTKRLYLAKVVEREPPWFRVLLPDGRDVWIDESATVDSTPPLGSKPAVNLPIPPSPPRAELVDRALGLLVEEGEAAQLLAIGGYDFWFRSPAPTSLVELSSELESLDAIYSKRYGVAPVAAPLGVVFLFEREENYRQLEKQSGVRGFGHTRGTMVALYLEGRTPIEIQQTILHELTHLLNRRALGPVLPPWLEEGLAVDLAASLLLDRVRGDYRVWRVVEGNQILFQGPLGGLESLRKASALTSLLESRKLLALTEDNIARASEPALLYAHFGFLIRSLIDVRDPASGAELKSGLRRFLREVRRGEDPTATFFFSQLGVDGPGLDGAFRDWIQAESVRAGLVAAPVGQD